MRVELMREQAYAMFVPCRVGKATKPKQQWLFWHPDATDVVTGKDVLKIYRNSTEYSE